MNIFVHMYISGCIALVECDVSTNFLTVIPESLTALINLKILDVHDNRISEVCSGVWRYVCV